MACLRSCAIESRVGRSPPSWVSPESTNQDVAADGSEGPHGGIDDATAGDVAESAERAIEDLRVSPQCDLLIESASCGCKAEKGCLKAREFPRCQVPAYQAPPNAFERFCKHDCTLEQLGLE